MIWTRAAVFINIPFFGTCFLLFFGPSAIWKPPGEQHSRGGSQLNICSKQILCIPQNPFCFYLGNISSLLWSSPLLNFYKTNLSSVLERSRFNNILDFFWKKMYGTKLTILSICFFLLISAADEAIDKLTGKAKEIVADVLKKSK